MSDPITNWIDGRIKVAMDELHADLQEDLTGIEARLTARITGLPGLLGDQIKNVAVDVEGIAEGVAGRMPPILQSLLNPAQLAQQIIQGILGGLPKLPFERGR